MKPSLRWKIFLGYLTPVVFMMAMAAIGQFSLESNLATTHWVIHTKDVMALAESLDRSIADAEAAQDGFQRTRTTSFLEAYDAATGAVERSSADLRTLVSDNAAQVERVDGIHASFSRWKSKQRDPSATDSDRGLLDETRRIADAFVGTEQDLLAQRLSANRSAVQLDRFASIVLPIVATFVTLATGLYLSGRLGRALTDLATTASSLAAGELEQRARVTSEDELGKLASSFNVMADRLIERSRDAQVLRDLGEELQSCLKMEEAYDAFRRFAPRALPNSSGAAYVINASRNLVVRVLHWGDDTSQDSFTSEQCWALRRGRPHRAEPGGSFCSHVRPSAGESLCIPLVAQGESIGVLHLAAQADHAGGARTKLVEASAEQLALAVANLQLREKLEWQSVRDPLTGLFNRRYLEETLAREILRSERGGQTLGALVFDVDYFKRFNDTFGHEAGDLVLREIGGVAARSFRAGDVACRYGGEEFVVIAAGATADQLVARAERLRETVQKLSLAHRGVVLGTTTISVGVAVFPMHASNGDALLRAADRALYAAKSEGRNRVRLAEQVRSSLANSMAPDPKSGALETLPRLVPDSKTRG